MAKAKRQPAPTTNDLVKQRLLYPLGEAAQLLGRHRTSLYDLARQGRLELVRDGGRTYVLAEEIERYLTEELKPVALGERTTRAS